MLSRLGLSFRPRKGHMQSKVYPLRRYVLYELIVTRDA